ncbi:MAG: M36 family metallopeptidase [Flavobacteriaceae bacterium]
MKNTYKLILLLLSINTLIAQNSIKSINTTILQSALNSQINDGYQAEDVLSWKIQSDASSLNKDAWYYYLVQTHNGIEVRNALANINVSNGSASLNNISFVKNAGLKANSSIPLLNESDAVQKSLEYLNINSSSKLKVVEKNKNGIIFNKIDVTLSEVSVELVYEITKKGNLKLAWNVNLELKNQPHWWNIRIDAATGEYINKNDWVTSCTFGESSMTHASHTKEEVFDFFVNDSKENNNTETSFMAPSYRVLPYYIESPNHGDFELIVNPSHSTSSPNGWHFDGVIRSDTRGNNVVAYDDSSNPNNNGPTTNQSASGLVFDYAYGGPGVAANTYIDSAVTNLFYVSNVVHDVYYLYGFDEASGNFQEQNYGNGGDGGDPVLAEAQDGGGTNNANFTTPNDNAFNNSPRMQMYLWDQGAYDPNQGPLLEVNNTVIAGIYPALDNNFDAPGHVTPNGAITADLVLARDGSLPINDLCQTATNGANMNGKIVVIKRGDCSFVSKVVKAQNEGAIAVLILNNVAGNILMGGTTADGTVTIPAYSLNQSDGDILLNQMDIETVNATFYEPTPPPPFVNIDGDFDNGVIAHEFGHGINKRLVGGRNNTSCVSATESMGEGWGDYIGKVLLLKNLDNGIAFSGTGTFVVGQAPDGVGIRPQAYSGDIENNPMTYETLRADTANATYSVPHGVGSVWAGMLWDLTWDLIAIHGFNSDIYDVNGTEGNIVALKLIVEAMKTTPCQPGFVDGRDAILLADQTLFGGANECAIWGAFARRGLGENADQGSVNSTSDGMHDYTNPAACAANYVMTIGGDTEVCEGGSLDFDMVFNAQNGWNTAVGFIASGQPGGSTVSFSPTTISDTGLVTMNVANLAPGNHTITVTPGGDTNKNLTLNIVVNAENPILGDGDTQYSDNGGAYTSFNDGATIAIAPGNNLDLNLPTAFAGSLLWTAPNGTTYTTDTVNFTNIVDGNTAVEGAWTVVASFDNECSTSSETVNFTVNVDPSLSVNENEFDNLSIYPNPTSGILSIGSSNNLDAAIVSVYDIAGRALNNAVAAKHNSSNELSLNMSQLASGVYFVTIEDRDHKSTKKIIKE